ncbi:hypothetical protein GQ42DRAFT_161390 [Ramicandelaber brevisporus]|nr:hypothetical protein GQ42DRAFT_161390 [Ramicandelaber brevisporus]
MHPIYCYTNAYRAVGFLLGASFAGAAGYYALLDEYQRASGLILSSVDSLHRSTVKIHDYVHKIEHIDHELTKLKEAMVTNDRHESLRRQVNELQAQVQKDGAVLRNELSQITQDATKVIDLALQKSYEN